MSTIIGLVSTFRLPLHARTFWTSTCLLDASKSILLFCHEYFGLSLEFSSFQGPIHHFLATVLDLQQPFICSKVQSATFSQSIWTFTYLLFASRSNRLYPCTSQQKVDTTLYFYTSFNEHNTPYTVLESDNSESMPDVLH